MEQEVLDDADGGPRCRQADVHHARGARGRRARHAARPAWSRRRHLGRNGAPCHRRRRARVGSRTRPDRRGLQVRLAAGRHRRCTSSDVLLSGPGARRRALPARDVAAAATARGAAGRSATPRSPATVMWPFVEGEIDRGRLRPDGRGELRRVRHARGVPGRRPRRDGVGCTAVAARAVPRADARVQGRRAAAGRPAVRPRARPSAGSASASSAPPRATPARRRSRRAATASTSTSSCCSPTAGSPRCSAAR
jgi:hypothetical protein